MTFIIFVINKMPPNFVNLFLEKYGNVTAWRNTYISLILSNYSLYPKISQNIATSDSTYFRLVKS